MIKNIILTIQFLSIVCSFQLVAQSTKKFTISGYINEKGSKENLPGATIYEPKLKAGSVSNNYGFYSLTLPEDSVTIIISYVGYQPQVFKLFLNKDVQLNVDLGQNGELKTVEIVAEAKDKVSQSTEMSVIDIPIKQIKDIPAFLGEKDVLKVLQLMPGVQKGGEGSAGFYVRGGGADQNLIILDGAPVYNAFHLFGFFSLFNGDALKSVSLVKGGFPARYGGRLSSVVEMTMKDGNKEKIHAEGGIGLLSSRLTIEGPIVKGKSSFLISGRRTYIDVLTTPIIKALNEGVSVGYYFYDLNAKFNYDLNQKNRLFLSGYFGKDKFYMKDKTDANSWFKASLGWGNATATARWNHLFGGKLFSNTSFIFTNYKFIVSAEDTEGSDFYKMQYYSGVRDYGLKYDLDYHPQSKHYIRMGAQVTYHTFTPNAFTVKNSYVPDNNISKKTKTIGVESALYLEDDWKVLPVLKMNIGARFTNLAVQSKNYFNVEPRLTVAYNLKRDLALKASYAVMNQYIQLISNTGVGLPTDLWVPSTKRLKPQNSKQVALGIAKDFNKQELALTVEGYYKTMDHILGFKEGASFLDVGITNNTNISWENNVTQGHGWSYGGEIFLQRKKGKFTGWIGYTLSWTQLQFDSLNFGKKFYAKYDRRHDFSLVGIYNVRKAVEGKNGITLSATWVYGTGNAITLPMARYEAPKPYNPNVGTYVYGNPVTEYTEKNAFRMAAFHRLDFSIQITKKKKRFERTWEISVYNIYNRKNPYFYYLETNQSGTTVLKQVSLFPIIPSISYNFKF